MATKDHTTYSVYRIVCFVSGNCYVGQTMNTDKRKRSHFDALKRGEHRNSHLQNAYNKYGRKSFYFEVMERDIAESDISEREIWWIAHFDSYHNGYNLTLGGEDRSYAYKICTWNGVEYPSIKDAAIALGVSHNTLRGRIRLGHTGDATIGREIPVIWNGIEYESMRKAAKANNVAAVTMQTRIHKGWTCDADIPTKSKRVIWNGVEYGSIREAAQAINIPYATMIVRAARGWTSDADVKHESRNEWSLIVRRPKKQ